MDIFFNFSLGLEGSYPPSILSQSRIGAILAPVLSLAFETGSSKASPIEMLETDIENDKKVLNEALSKEKLNTLVSNSSATISTDDISLKNKDGMSRKFSSSDLSCAEENANGKHEREENGSRRYSLTESCSGEEKEDVKKDKQRGIKHTLKRSLSSLTILGSKMTSNDNKVSKSGGRSVSAVQLSEVGIINIVVYIYIITIRFSIFHGR